MIRIVGIQHSSNPQREFVLLQNQGGMRIDLRGHVVVPDCAIRAGQLYPAHVFSEEVWLTPGTYVLLKTGIGQPKWTVTPEGQRVFTVFMGRSAPVWDGIEGELHVLHIQHSYVERPLAAVR